MFNSEAYDDFTKMSSKSIPKHSAYLLMKCYERLNNTCTNYDSIKYILIKTVPTKIDNQGL